jgi:hypothetical protein
MPASEAAIAVAIKSDFLQAVREDRVESWTPPANLRVAAVLGDIREFDEFDLFVAGLALNDRRSGVREASILALQNREGPGVVLLAQQLTDYWQATELRVLFMRAQNARH